MAGRGRPRSFDRQRALETAMQVFWTKGYKGTSMADLTLALGINSPSLYAAFGCKEALFREALTLYESTHGTPVWAPVDEALTAREGIAGVLRESAERFCQPDSPGGCFVTLASVHEGDDEPAGAPIFDELRRMRLGPMCRLQARLERAIHEGELPQTADAAGIASFYLTFQQGMSLRARDGASREQLLALAECAMRAWDALIPSREALAATASSIASSK